MVVSGLLLSLRRGDFVDKSTGEHIQFCHLKIAQPSDSADIIGLDDQKIKVPFDSFDKLRSQVLSLIGKFVEVDVDIKMKGRYVNLQALAVRPAAG
jgi:septum formation topological specificity factor MinE